MEIIEQKVFSVELAEDLRRLLPQLSSNAKTPDDDFVRAIVESESSHLLVAREGDNVLGFLTLAVFLVPTGVRAWVEDVVVDTAARGQGVGERLIQSALALAEELGARTVDLTSRPGREAANRLYQRVGFVQRDTNIYRYSIG